MREWFRLLIVWTVLTGWVGAGEPVLIGMVGSARSDPAWLPASVPVFLIKWSPADAPGETWLVDWAAWARTLQVAVADVAEAPRGAVIGSIGLEDTVLEEATAFLRSGDFWPATGAWSLRAFPDYRAIEPRDQVRVLIAANPRVLMTMDGAPRTPTVAVWLDALVLHQLEAGAVAAAVVPHWIEAGGQVVDRVVARRKGLEDRASPAHRIGPLVVAAENTSAWKTFWLRWQY